MAILLCEVGKSTHVPKPTVTKTQAICKHAIFLIYAGMAKHGIAKTSCSYTSAKNKNANRVLLGVDQLNRNTFKPEILHSTKKFAKTNASTINTIYQIIRFLLSVYIIY